MSNAVAEFERDQFNEHNHVSMKNQTSYLVKSRDEIISLLTKTYKAHTLLSVNFEDVQKDFGSLLLEVNLQGDYLVLDEIYPRNAINFPLQQQKLLISTRLEGIELSFSGTIDAISRTDNSEYYKVSIPKGIYYQQRRSSYRVPISINNPLTVALSTRDDVLIHAELRDLSQHGFCARTTTPGAETLSKGEEIPTCIIHTPDGKKIITSLEIVRIEEAKPFNSVKLGVRFLSLSKTDQQELARLVAQLDRENVKTLKRQEG